MAVGEARDLRQVRDRDHLGTSREAAKRLADRVRGLAADSGVDLVKHHRLAAGHSRDRERDPRELAARGGLGDRPEGQAGVRADEKHRLVGARRAGVDVPHLGAELPLTEAHADKLPPHGFGEARRGFAARRAKLCVHPIDLGLRSSHRIGCGPHGIVAVGKLGELAPGLVGTIEQLRVGLSAIAAAQVGEPVELRLDGVEPARLRLERVEERTQVGRDLTQGELGRAKRLAGSGELGCQALERSELALGQTGKVRGGPAVVLSGERSHGGACAGRELGQMAEALPFGSQVVLVAPLEPFCVGNERLQLVQPLLRGGRVARQLRPGRARAEASSRQARRAARAASRDPANESSTASW